MAKYKRFINDEQWKKLEPLLPQPKRISHKKVDSAKTCLAREFTPLGGAL